LKTRSEWRPISTKSGTPTVSALDRATPIFKLRLQQGFAVREMGLRGQVARQQFHAVHVADGSRLCKNVTARDGDRMNVSPNRNYGSGSSQACSLLLDPRKIILGGSEIFAFLHSLGQKQT
jgi:hypothetical protein